MSGDMDCVSEGWAIELCGHHFDLDDLRCKLKVPFDPWVEDYQDGSQLKLLLRAKDWATLEGATEVMSDATRLLDLINGAQLVEQSDAEPILSGEVLRFNADGTRVPVLVAGTGSVILKGGRVRAFVAKVCGADIADPLPSPMQIWLEKASNVDAMSDLLRFIIRADNWFDLYKGMECVERLLGPKAAKSLASDWGRVWQTANCHRHAPNPKFPPPAQPAGFDEAMALLLLVAKHALEHQPQVS